MDILYDYLESRISELKLKLSYYQGKDNYSMVEYIQGMLSAYTDIYNNILAGKYRDKEG